MPDVMPDAGADVQCLLIDKKMLRYGSNTNEMECVHALGGDGHDDNR